MTMRFSVLANMERFAPADPPHARQLAALADWARAAEAGGFETFWLAEHHAIEFTAAPAPLNLISHLAGQTARIRLGTAIVVAPYWHPVKLAGEAALTDLICGGRLELGVARGAYQYEYDRLAGGMPPATAGAFLREMIPALRGLWRGDYAADGECWKFPAATAVPKPLQRPHPPLWVAARDLETHRFAVAAGCGVMATPLSKNDDEVADLAAKFDQAVGEHSAMPRPRLMMMRFGFVGENEKEVDAAARALARYGRRFENLFRGIGQVRDGFPEPVGAADDDDPERLRVAREHHLVGTPDEVIPRLKKYEALGVDQFCLNLDSGLDGAAKLRSLRLFAREVMPAFA